MKKIIIAAGFLIALNGSGQLKQNLTNNYESNSTHKSKLDAEKIMNNLIGTWEIIGSKSEGGALEIVDANTINMNYDGQKKKITGFTLNVDKSPMWFDFYVKDGEDEVQVKSIMEVISEDLIKWQVFMDEERNEHFTAQKGEMFYLKRQKIKNVVTFATEWDKKNYNASLK